MHFTEDLPSGNYIINSYTDNSVTINKQRHENSLYLSPSTLLDDISIQISSDLTVDSVQFIVALQPEIIILGSGKSLQFPPPAIIAHFASHKIGFETMDHSAACRTFAILAVERRHVGLLLLMGSSY